MNYDAIIYQVHEAVKMKLVGKCFVCDLTDQGINLLLTAFVCPGCLNWHLAVGEVDAAGNVTTIDLNSNPVTLDEYDDNEKFATFADAVDAAWQIIQDHDPTHAKRYELSWRVFDLDEILQSFDGEKGLPIPPNGGTVQ